jgi:pimeloyl-ACP methyl ester carboxylesterase
MHTAADREVHRSQPRLVSANGVDLCVQTYGQAGEPAILLVAGAANSMDWWEDEFCERLASGPRFVIRYDLRDTGQSVSYEPGAPGYDGSDLVADAVGLLDALEIARAHVVGISMGGGIGQHLALEHADRAARRRALPGRRVSPLPPLRAQLHAARHRERPPARPPLTLHEAPPGSAPGCVVVSNAG